jgi:hypothetical protein
MNTNTPLDKGADVDTDMVIDRDRDTDTETDMDKDTGTCTGTWHVHGHQNASKVRNVPRHRNYELEYNSEISDKQNNSYK